MKQVFRIFSKLKRLHIIPSDATNQLQASHKAQRQQHQRSSVPIIRINLIIAANCRTAQSCRFPSLSLIYGHKFPRFFIVSPLLSYNFFHDSCLNAHGERRQEKAKTKISGEMIKMIRDALQAFFAFKMTLNLCNVCAVTFREKHAKPHTRHRSRTSHVVIALKNETKVEVMTVQSDFGAVWGQGISSAYSRDLIYICTFAGTFSSAEKS